MPLEGQKIKDEYSSNVSIMKYAPNLTSKNTTPKLCWKCKQNSFISWNKISWQGTKFYNKHKTSYRPKLILDLPGVTAGEKLNLPNFKSFIGWGLLRFETVRKNERGFESCEVNNRSPKALRSPFEPSPSQSIQTYKCIKKKSKCVGKYGIYFTID
jgi:hypothetical protein